MTGQPHEVLLAAADLLEQRASGFQAEHFWQRDIEAARDLSVGSTAWAKTMGPAVAVPLVVWLRKNARRCKFEVAACSSPKNSEAFVDDYYGAALDFARMVLASTT